MVLLNFLPSLSKVFAVVLPSGVLIDFDAFVPFELYVRETVLPLESFAVKVPSSETFTFE